MAEQKATNITWHEGDVTREDREKLLKQKGATLWFTGLSGSGKSTVAVAVEKVLLERGHLCYRLDGDNIRFGINKNLGFSAEDRTENIRRIGEICKLFSDTGVITLASFVSPYRIDRDNVRNLMEAGELPFIEVYCNVSLETAEKRDPKGLYKKARAGEIKNFTGIDDPYEEPKRPELDLDGDKMSLQEEVDAVVAYLEEQGII